jgi:hypothetical protein
MSTSNYYQPYFWRVFINKPTYFAALREYPVETFSAARVQN